MRGVIELPIRLEPEDLLRYMGYKGGRRPSSRVEARMSELWPGILRGLRPRGAFRIVTGKEAAAAGMPGPAEKVGLGLVTIGPALEDEARKSGEEGAPLDALILDAAGSAAAEAAADALNAELCKEAGRRGLYVAHRVSPGYGKWQVASQPSLLAFLPAEALDVSLTAGLMMVPRKSVSFAANLTEEPPRGSTRADRCARCGLKGCPYGP